MRRICMKRVLYFRAVVAFVVVVVLSVGVSARPRDERPIREPKEKLEPIVKIIKRIAKALGDGMTIPTP
jgi:hypothetical protein